MSNPRFIQEEENQPVTASRGEEHGSGAGIRSSTSANCRTISESRRRISAKAPAVKPGSMVVNSSRGGGSKDTWVLGE